MSELAVGTIVTGIYKTGKYIGEITEIRPQSYLVRVLAVVKHPLQGDLHHPKQAEVVMFHERRALAYREQTNIPKQMVKPFEAEIPDYKQSLIEACETAIETFMKEDSEFAKRSMENLHVLLADYQSK